MKELSTFFARSVEAVDATLDELAAAGGVESERLEQAIRWSLFGGGKRFRPALTLAVGHVFGVPEERLLRTAAAVEMIHTYSLVHDDLPAMDDDELRRGRAACHIKFGEATAILAGDLLQVVAFRAVAEDATLPEGMRARLVSELASATGRMIAGQQMDLQSEAKGVSPTEVESIHRNKTGALICFSARAGAHIGGANRDELRAITRYSAKLGLMFQISDDILDLTQTADRLGKTAAKDIASAKATYPSVYGLRRSREMLQEIHFEAVGHLSRIKCSTGILKSIADFIVEREL